VQARWDGIQSGETNSGRRKKQASKQELTEDFEEELKE
jgi:hypothetical protein